MQLQIECIHIERRLRRENEFGMEKEEEKEKERKRVLHIRQSQNLHLIYPFLDHILQYHNAICARCMFELVKIPDMHYFRMK